MSVAEDQVLPASALFHAPDLHEAHADSVLTLAGPEGHHAVTVRRLRVGERIQVTDGCGRIVTGVVHSTSGRDRIDVHVQQIVNVVQPTPTLTVVQALLKGATGADAVDALTEVGVDHVIPWMASRCVTRAAVGESLPRWERAAQEAGKQSRRAWWPRVSAVVDTAGLIGLIQQQRDAGVPVYLLHESATTPLPALLPTTPTDTVLVVGPEGGLSPEEVAQMRHAGGTSVSLGPTVLRATLAGAVAAGVVAAGMGRWRGEPAEGMTGSGL